MPCNSEHVASLHISYVVFPNVNIIIISLQSVSFPRSSTYPKTDHEKQQRSFAKHQENLKKKKKTDLILT